MATMYRAWILGCQSSTICWAEKKLGTITQEWYRRCISYFYIEDVLVTFLAAIMPEKSNSGRKGSFWLRVWGLSQQGRYAAMGVTSCGYQSLRQLGALHPQSGSPEQCMPVHAACFLILISVRLQACKAWKTTVRVGSSLSQTLRKCPHRASHLFVSSVVLNSDKMAMKIDCHRWRRSARAYCSRWRLM